MDSGAGPSKRRSDTDPTSGLKRTLMDSGAGPLKRREVGQVTSGLKRSADDDLDEIRRVSDRSWIWTKLKDLFSKV